MSNTRVRFAPSPTGPLHIGGVRTALYNYLLAKKTGGTFILRIEDTDQKRYVPGAEAYIKEALEWFGITPDEGPDYGGAHGPYRQSERKDLYAKYVQAMVDKGHAYYAFDTEEELSKIREEEKVKGNHSFKYNWEIRKKMRNSISLSPDETKKLLEENHSYTVRLKIPQNETISFQDVVRGEVSFESNELDDKVIMKADGMPTYHLANIVDDHLMEISHVIRGEEWFLNPTGGGKLSKRHGAKFGFPVFPLQWDAGEEIFQGFREDGFDSDAVINFLSLLGWNPGNDEEVFSLPQMVDLFSLDNIVKSGAKFDFDKAKWFNQQYIIKKEDGEILKNLRASNVASKIDNRSDAFMLKLIAMMKERVTTYPDFVNGAEYLYGLPTEYDEKTLKKKYKADNQEHFNAIHKLIETADDFSAESLSEQIKTYIKEKELSFGAIFPILRIVLSGTMKGPDLFGMMELIGKDDALIRWKEGFKIIEGLNK